MKKTQLIIILAITLTAISCAPKKQQTQDEKSVQNENSNLAVNESQESNVMPANDSANPTTTQPLQEAQTEQNEINKQPAEEATENDGLFVNDSEPTVDNGQNSIQQTDFSNRKPFKYTIRTDIESDWHSKDIEILVSVGRMIKECSAFGNLESEECDESKGYHELKYDLDCEGDGEYEYNGLTESKKCIFKRNSGKHQIWVRGEIPVMWLCARKESQSHCRDNASDFQCSPLMGAPDESWDAVISVDDWGDIQWKSMYGFAADCAVLNKLPNNPPDLSQVKEMNYMFLDAIAFNQPLEEWNVSNVTNMYAMFENAQSFNQPLEKWNVSKVTNMSTMFYGALEFDQPLEKWNVSNVKDMSFMFTEAESFNQPLAKWNISNVKNMGFMFHDAKSFNQPLNEWNVSNVIDMSGMFERANSFGYYPDSWIIPEGLKDMFKGTPVEAIAKEKPLKTEKRGE